MRRGLGTTGTTLNVPIPNNRGARRRRAEQEIENLFEKIMKENFPNLAKKIDIQSRKLRESQTSWTQRGTHQDTP